MAISAYQANPQEQVLREALDVANEHLSIALTVWAFSWFVLELGMTTTTIFFLYRVRTGLSMHDGIFSTIWQILWISVTPPFILMTIIVVDGYITPGTSGVASKIAVGITAKFFTLSLMINLVGQGHIRDKFNRSHMTPPSLSSNIPDAVISEARFAHGIVSVRTANLESRRSVSDTESTRFGSLDAHQRQHEHEEKIEKREVNIGHTNTGCRI
ncbi:unnamed protein product [Rhizoctonia solani]|uniref:Uncharacterized protein n=1 Tax=Rhizoctonia solani TaxID=456999 RepID=A0A8H3AQ28_9AGAM|nr:unnamed protein product [Rhizoctonia solani]